MSTQNSLMNQDAVENPTSFPLIRPEMQITELDEPPFAVDCEELRSWTIIPRVGEQAACAQYFLPGWKLGEVSTMEALRTARVHGIDCVEIAVRRWKAESGWQCPGAFYARLTADKAEFLAVHLPQENFTQVETFLDDSFASNWGAVDRAISDSGLLKRASDGSISLSDATPSQSERVIGFGVARLEISGKPFTCLRVLEIPGDLAKSGADHVVESYLTREGRSVLARSYCRPRFVEAAQFPVLLDESKRLVINGVTFVHWCDTIAEIAL